MLTALTVKHAASSSVASIRSSGGDDVADQGKGRPRKTRAGSKRSPRRSRGRSRRRDDRSEARQAQAPSSPGRRRPRSRIPPAASNADHSRPRTGRGPHPRCSRPPLLENSLPGIARPHQEDPRPIRALKVFLEMLLFALAFGMAEPRKQRTAVEHHRRIGGKHHVRQTRDARHDLDAAPPWQRAPRRAIGSCA